ncbi:hypothetical protein FOA43_003619 [Brettanomyces nanus]|uniref:H/ACA ribonucleoprotein complex non-core subunit NAF1 n=1 Tax=Eeniella nana TaxID=13502 RepID=A0A875S5N0_EENNA|nr:uncharacterized protein FOA43_003619 [Brettanomyces nanus]QPG76233.1 hypothetical protein FOA43_003619 [Brettanomyces nanus]
MEEKVLESSEELHNGAVADDNNEQAVHEDSIFDKKTDFSYSSDEYEPELKEPTEEQKKEQSPKAKDVADSVLSSNSRSGTSSSSDSDSDSNSNSNSNSNSGLSVSNPGSESEDNVTDFEEDKDNDNDEGPIRSKNEIVDENAPSLPDDFIIDSNTPIRYLGNVTGIVEKNVIIQSSASAEYQVLEGAILCLKDRTPLGPLFEVFGRIHSPVYRLKYNTKQDLEKRSIKKGDQVYYVIPSAQFELTQNIKAIKGSDASNWNDEEIPEEEQEFSDDEKEKAAKRMKKRKHKNKTNSDNKKKKTDEIGSTSKKLIPDYIKSRLTSLPSSQASKKKDNKSKDSQSKDGGDQILMNDRSNISRQVYPQPLSIPCSIAASSQQPVSSTSQYSPAPLLNVLSQTSQAFVSIMNPQNQVQSSQNMTQQTHQQSEPPFSLDSTNQGQLLQNLISNVQSNFDQQQAKILAQIVSLLANQTKSAVTSIHSAVQNTLPANSEVYPCLEGQSMGPYAIQHGQMQNEDIKYSTAVDEEEADDADAYDPENPN